MDEYSIGDIVLLEFPFTDGNTTKKRPALVLYHDKIDNELLLARITSKIYYSESDLEINNWKESGLLIKSCIRLKKIATLSCNLVYRKLGKLNTEDYENLIKTIQKIISNLK